MNNREKLIDLMHEHQLDKRELGELVRADRDAVHAWLLPPEAPRSKQVPDMAIELLELKIQLGMHVADGTEASAASGATNVASNDDVPAAPSLDSDE